MTDPHWLDDEFERMGQTVMPRFQPPGVQAANRVVRRRKARRVRAAMALAVCVLLAGTLEVTSTPDASNTPVTPATPLTSSTPAPQQSPPPSANVPSESDTPSPIIGAPQGTGPRAQPTCANPGYVTLSQAPGGEFLARLDTDGPAFEMLCPDGVAPVFWATYTVDVDGTHHLYRSQRYELTYALAEVQMRLELPPRDSCTGFAYYIVGGDMPIATTVPGALNARNLGSPPYAYRKNMWNVQFPCPPSAPPT